MTRQGFLCLRVLVAYLYLFLPIYATPTISYSTCIWRTLQAFTLEVPLRLHGNSKTTHPIHPRG